MSGNFTLSDSILGTIDIEEKFVTDAWLVDQFVGGTLFSCGYNAYGQLGNATINIYYSSPVQVGSLTNWKQIAASLHCIANKTDGTLWTWGNNAAGQLGNNTFNTTYSSPIQIGALTNWKQVACGYLYSAAIKTDGTLWAWGWNTKGQLGNGTTINYSSPIQIGSLTNWKQVSCTGGQSSDGGSIAAVKTDGTLWTWGYNAYSQLGTTAITLDYSSPVQVGSLTNWKQVACARFAMAAIKTDGTLWTWGYPGNGQLGTNTNANDLTYFSPVQVGGLTNWKFIDAGREYMMSLKTDGTLWTWGYNGYGGLGNGTRIDYSSPIQVGSLTNWKFISFSGLQIALAIKTDGTLWAWGYNSLGQLGNGTTIQYSSPIQVGSLTNWKQVSGGKYSFAAITFNDLG